MRKKHPRLTGFHLSRVSCKSLEVGVRDKVDLVAGQTAQVTVRRAADRNNRVQLTVAPPLMGEITYDTCCGKFFPVVTPYETKKKDRLIIAVMVTPCKDK